MNKSSSIILIGMPGCGKSTAGVLTAKAACKSFLDTDLLLQQEIGSSLQTFLDRYGYEAFLQREEKILTGLNARNTVIATGGSAVYSERGMLHVKELGSVVYLHLCFSCMQKRLSDIRTRGIVFRRGQDLRQMYEERLLLYRKYADFTVDCSEQTVEETVEGILSALSLR